MPRPAGRARAALGRSPPPPELAELSRLLRAPLPPALVEGKGLIELPKAYPGERASALNRLNRYRLAAGLRPYVYDQSLSAMGQAHADYLLAATGMKIASGHFELAGNKYYTKAGDEAARTSGISQGNSDPLSALEGLMSGTLHRLQFLRPEELRVGLGFAYDPASRGGGTLFVTREAPAPPGTSEARGRFILFPPPGFDDALCDFGNGEYPDPRPSRSPADSPTGYPITISLSWDDLRSFEMASARLTNEAGLELPAWISYPGKPAVAVPDMGIYSGDAASISKSYRDNFNAVFILPKEPLARGATFSVHATLRIAGKDENLDWKFKTRGATLWTVRAVPDRPGQDLAAALKMAASGNTIQLAAGEYRFADELHIKAAVRIVGIPRKTLLRYSGPEKLAAFAIGGAAARRGLDFDERSSFYLGGGSSLALEDCSFTRRAQASSLVTCEPSSIVAFERCDLFACAGAILAYFLDRPRGGAQASLYIGLGNKTGGSTRLSYGQGGERRLSSPIDKF